MRRASVLIVLLASCLLLSAPATAATIPSYSIQTIIPLPAPLSALTGGPASVDISFVDSVAETYAFADRTNKSLDIFDASRNTFLRSVPGFKGTPGTNFGN